MFITTKLVELLKYSKIKVQKRKHWRQAKYIKYLATSENLVVGLSTLNENNIECLKILTIKHGVEGKLIKMRATTLYIVIA